MFQFFRRQDAAVRYFLGGLLVFICFSMVGYLIPGLGSSPTEADGSTTLGKVCGTPVTSTELIHQFQQMAQGNKLPSSFLAVYAPTILKNITDEKAIDCEARRVGLTVTDEELASRLRANPGLFPGGVFIGSDRYREIIETRLNMPVETFEDNVRTEILRGKLRGLVTDAVNVSDKEADAEFHHQNDKVKVDYVLLQASQFVGDVKMDEVQIKEFFERTKENFRLPERRKVKYAVLDVNRVKESAVVTQDEVRAYYERNRDRYRVDERIKLSHLLQKTIDKTPDQVKEAEKKANDLLARIRKGEDFAALATANSDDPDSAKRGGDMGWIKRGQIADKDLEKTAFGLAPGAVSGVIKTQYGFDILKVAEHEQAHQKTMAEVTVEILQAVKAEKADRAEQAAADQLEAALRKGPKQLEDLAALNMIVSEAPAHERGGPLPGLGVAPSADDVIFTLKQGDLSGIVTVNGQKAVFQVTELLPSRLPELSEVRARVEPDFKTAKSIDIFNQRSGEFRDRMKALGDLKKAAKEKKYEVKTSADLNATGRIDEFGASKDFPAAAFTMKVGDTAGPVSGGSSKDMFYQLVETKIATPEETAAGRDGVRTQMSEEKRAAFFAIFMDQLRERLTKQGKLTTNDAAVKRLAASYQ